MCQGYVMWLLKFAFRNVNGSSQSTSPHTSLYKRIRYFRSCLPFYNRIRPLRHYIQMKNCTISLKHIRYHMTSFDPSRQNSLSPDSDIIYQNTSLDKTAHTLPRRILQCLPRIAWACPELVLFFLGGSRPLSNCPLVSPLREWPFYFLSREYIV